MNAHRWALWLFGAYLVSVPLVRLVQIPGLPRAFGLPEVLFLALLPMVAYLVYQQKNGAVLSPGLLDASVVLLVLSQWIAASRGGQQGAELSPLIITYLAAFYFVGKTLLLAVGPSPNLISRSVLALGMVVIASIALSLWSTSSPSLNIAGLTEAKYLPHLGWRQRAMGLTMSPNMLLNICGLPVFAGLAYGLQYRSKKWLAISLLLLLAAWATWSKSLVLLVAGSLVLLAIGYPVAGYLKKIGLCLALAAVGCWLFSTKLIVLEREQADYTTVLRQSYATDQLVMTIGNAEVYQSMHYLLNEKAISAWLVHPWLGIGAGQFIPYLEQQQAAGKYPGNKPLYAPHSLYLGTLAQSGILGFGALVFFLYALAKKWQSLHQKVAAQHRWLALALGVFLLFWLTDSLSMDTLHFRHCWWVVIVIAAWEQVLRSRKWEVGVRK